MFDTFAQDRISIPPMMPSGEMATTGKAKNRLGKLLMELRNGLEGYEPIFFLPPWIALPDINA